MCATLCVCLRLICLSDNHIPCGYLVSFAHVRPLSRYHVLHTIANMLAKWSARACLILTPANILRRHSTTATTTTTNSFCVSLTIPLDINIHAANRWTINWERPRVRQLTHHFLILGRNITASLAIANSALCSFVYI